MNPVPLVLGPILIAFGIGWIVSAVRYYRRGERTGWVGDEYPPEQREYGWISAVIMTPVLIAIGIFCVIGAFFPAPAP